MHYGTDKWAVIPKLATNILNPGSVLNGELTGPPWDDAASVSQFQTAYYERNVPSIEYKMTYDDHHLYIGGMMSVEEAESLQKIEILIKRSTEFPTYYVASVPITNSHPASRARLNTIWNPSFNEQTLDEGRVNIQGVIYNTHQTGSELHVEIAIPILRAISASGIRSGDEWQFNIMHVHHLYTRPLTSWIPVRQSSQWDTGHSESGSSANVYAYVIGQNRMGSIFFDRLPDHIVSSGEEADVKMNRMLRLEYIGFNEKRLYIDLAHGESVEDAQLYWQSPGEKWQLLSEVTHVDVGIFHFHHPGPMSDGIYKLMVISRDGHAPTASIMTFDREYMIEAGIRVNPSFPATEVTDTSIEWIPPTDRVENIIDLIPPQPGFRHSGLPENPDLYPDGTFLFRLNPDQRSLISIPTGTIYPSDDPILKESKQLVFMDKKNESSVFPYFEDKQGRSYFVTGHLWYVQKSAAINQAVQLAKVDPLGTARVLYAFLKAYKRWQPTGDRNWFNRIIPADSGPPYAYWGGTWSRWWWGDLGAVSKLAEAYAAIRHTNALQLLSDEVGEDVEKKIIEEMFLPSIDFALTYPATRGNMANSLWQGLIRMGLALRDPDIIHRAAELVKDFLMEGKFLSDGFWSEVTLSYHAQTINGLVNSINLLNGWTDPEGYISPRTGIRFDNLNMAEQFPIIGKALDINRIMVYPDGKYVPIMDTWANGRSASPNIDAGSFLLPAARIGRFVVGTGPSQTQVNINFQPKYGHVHRDGINLTLFANGQELLPDIGYSHSSKYRWFTTSTIGHNTVVVNSQDMPNNALSRHGGNIEMYVTSPSLQVMRASYVGPYASVREYAREVWLVPFADGDEREGYVLDLFRVEGGQRHEYTLQGDANRDAVFEVDRPTTPYGPYLLPPGTRVTQPTGPSQSGSAEGHYPGYIYIRDVEEADVNDNRFTITLLTEQFGRHVPTLNITGLLGDRDHQLFLGRSPSLRAVRFGGKAEDNNHTADLYSMPKIVLRRDGHNLRSDFVTVMEPFYGRQHPRIDVIEPLLINEGPKGSVAVQIMYDDTIDILLSNPHYDEGPLVVGDIRLDGEVGFIRMKDGNVTEMRLIGGTNLEKGTVSMRGKGRIVGNVLSTLRKESGDHVDGIVADARVSCGVGGHHVVIHHPDGTTSGFEIDRLERQDGKRVIVFSEHDPAFDINQDGSSQQLYHPRKTWNDNHTFEIVYMDTRSVPKGDAKEIHTTSVQGVVYDKYGDPLGNALVYPVGYYSLSTQTDHAGKFQIDAVPVGMQWIKVEHEDYIPYVSNSLMLHENEITSITITLTEPMPPELHDNVVMIHNAMELQAISQDLTAHYALANDIDASETADWNDGAGFEPVGDTFTGIFDGMGHTIFGLTIQRPDDPKVALFQNNEGIIRNVTLDAVSIKGYSHVAAVAGINEGLIVNVHSSGDIIGSHRQVAGIAGDNLRSGARISYSSSSARVEGGDRWAGGLVGRNHLGTIEKSFSTGHVTNTSNAGFSGGFVGANTGKIYDSYATGGISGEGGVGGFVGVNETENAMIKRSYSTGVVSRDSGGFAATNKTGGEILSSFWDKELSQASSSAAGLGLPTADITDPNFWETAPIWEVEEKWDIDFEGNGNTTWYFLSGQSAPLLYPYSSE